MAGYNKALGDMGEREAAAYLEREGYAIIGQNQAEKPGEIDIIAKKDGCIVFVEVKTRSSVRFGAPSEAVDRRKQAHICKAALLYLQREDLLDSAARFDVIEVYAGEKPMRINHIISAFEYTC